MEDVPEESNGRKSAEAAVQEAQEAVSKLSEFNAHYFESHGVECASRKEEDVKRQLQETLVVLDRLQAVLPKVEHWYLRGKALNILPEHSPEAEQCLSRAIKHDPSLIDAWNGLGESYWKAGNVQQAHDCFTGALAHLKNKESLRNLSMVLRQIGKGPGEREGNVKKSVEKAREAVALDVTDGTSWMILGNAYLSLFFMAKQDPKMLKQCVSAYNQAEKDPVVANNPDLHFNRATLLQYEEEYGAALRELSIASALEPGWSVPRDQMDSIRHFLRSMAQLVASKGRLKAKRLSVLVSSISDSPEGKYVGAYASEKAVVPVGGLSEGVNEGTVFVGAVATSVPTQSKVPYACVLVDGAGESVGLTIYNLAQTTNFASGDIFTIPDPILIHTMLQEAETDCIEFWSLRVTNPEQLLLNGLQLPPEKLAPSTVAITAFC